MKKNIALILAFALPVLFIIIVAVVNYLPSLSIGTEYNFVYVTCDNSIGGYYGCDNYLRNRYVVENNKLVVREVVIPENIDTKASVSMDEASNYTTRIFMHNTKKNESREITVAEAQGFNLSELLTSPDGVSFSNGYDYGVDTPFFYSSRSMYNYYLMQGGNRRKINLISGGDQYYYNSNLQFVGWIIPDTK